jgi:hypothetical protein
MEVSGQLHTLATLPWGMYPWYPLNRRLGGPQNQSGHGGKEKNSRPLLGIQAWSFNPFYITARGERHDSLTRKCMSVLMAIFSKYASYERNVYGVKSLSKSQLCSNNVSNFTEY